MRASLILALCAVATAGAARAGEVACHFEGGVVTAPAEVAGIPGDYIIDTGTAQSVLHETRAQAEGIAESSLDGDVLLAGMRTSPLPLGVADLDVRTWNLPTPVAGVIGADVLKGFVVDVDFEPCRLRLSRPGEAPRFRGRATALTWDEGRPVTDAAVSDEAHEVQGPFVIATGANAPVRLADDLAEAPGAPRPAELYPDGVWLARLPGVTFGGEAGRDVAAGLMKPQGQAAGVLGGAVLAHFHLRFDFPGGRLVAAPARP